jgi:hypothetical protein
LCLLLQHNIISWFYIGALQPNFYLHMKHLFFPLDSLFLHTVVLQRGEGVYFAFLFISINETFIFGFASSSLDPIFISVCFSVLQRGEGVYFAFLFISINETFIFGFASSSLDPIFISVCFYSTFSIIELLSFIPSTST